MFCRDCKCDTSSGLPWFNPDPTAMGAYKPLTDRETQSGTACEACETIIHTIKAFKDMLSFLLGDPRTIIDDPEEKVISLPACFHSNRRLLSSVFDRVLDQIS